MTFGEYIREKGYTARYLAYKASVSVRSVENYTTGRRPARNMTLELAAKIAKALNMHAEQLLEFDDK